MEKREQIVGGIDKADIPKRVIYRLSIYHRCLRKLQETGQKTINSGELSGLAGVKSAQLRKDLTYFGQFGIRGLGYPVDALMATIRASLGRDLLQPVILIGAGNLGSALLRYQGFQREGFDVVAVFDCDPKSSRARNFKIPVKPMDELADFVKENLVQLSILCVPAEVAQHVADGLVHDGVKGILNFSPVQITAPKDVMINNVDLALELEQLSFFVQ